MKNYKNKQAVTFLSGSAGELDWILPIIDYLSKVEFKIKIIYLSRHVKKSVSNNLLLTNYINQFGNEIETVSCGGYFYELIEKCGYLMHRINIKLKKPILLRIFFYVIDKFCKSIFINQLPSNIFQNDGEGTIIFSESPSLRRPRDKWLKKIFSESIFFYCPHSPHIYSSDLDRKYLENDHIDTNKNYFLLMGHPSDYSSVDDDHEYAASDLEKVFIGHPKYSKRWLHTRQQKARSFRSSSADRKESNILVISRGHGSYIDEDRQRHLVETTVQVIQDQIPNYNMFVKKHPREIDSHWDKVIEDHSTIKIVKDHILDIATKVDFAITFWSSGAIDCNTLGVPVIEFYDPNKNPKQQISVGNNFTTIYRKLGLVHAANDEKDLAIAISGLLRRGSNMQLKKPHFFYDDLIERSDLWKEKIHEILATKNLLS